MRPKEELFEDPAPGASAGPCFTYSVDRECRFVLIPCSSLLCVAAAQLHAVVLWKPLVSASTLHRTSFDSFRASSECKEMLELRRGKVQFSWIVGEGGVEGKTKKNGDTFGLEDANYSVPEANLGFGVQTRPRHRQHPQRFRNNYVLKLLHLSNSGINKEGNQESWK